MNKHFILSFVSLTLLFVFSGCNGIFEQEKEIDIVYYIENNSNHPIKLIRYETFTDSSTTIDSLNIEIGELLIEGWKDDPFNDGFKYYGYDSIQVYYGDSLVINHFRLEYNSIPLNHPINDNFQWELIHSGKSSNYLTINSLKYIFTNDDFLEAKLKGRKIN